MQIVGGDLKSGYSKGIEDRRSRKALPKNREGFSCGATRNRTKDYLNIFRKIYLIINALHLRSYMIFIIYILIH